MKSILIIGAGPSGLAAAISSYQKNAKITLIEKRPFYSRIQLLKLDDQTLELLRSWEIDLPELRTFNLESEGTIHFVPIRFLEQALENKTKRLGISKVQGELIGLSKDALISKDNKKWHIPYDLIIGADGVNSSLRNTLQIPSIVFGEALARAIVFPVFFPSTDKVQVITVQTQHFHLRKLTTPTRIIVFVQTLPQSQAKEIPLKKMIDAIAECGWSEEAELAKNHQTRVFESLAVFLRQANYFYDESKAAVIIGDAAASTGFFHGTGVNTALKSSHIIGKFCKEPNFDYQSFNTEMKILTDGLINENKFLFCKP